MGLYAVVISITEEDGGNDYEDIFISLLIHPCLVPEKPYSSCCLCPQKSTLL